MVRAKAHAVCPDAICDVDPTGRELMAHQFRARSIDPTGRNDMARNFSRFVER
jgi:hypothetical protein